MNRVELIAQPLTRQAFEPFGDVIEVDENRCHYTINGGATERYNALAVTEANGENSRIAISIFRSLLATQLPVRVIALERHPLGSQAFIPLTASPFLVVVAPSGDHITSHEVRAFFCTGHQGVNYRPGVWHHSLLALNSGQDFLVVDRIGSNGNCDELTLTEEQILIVSPLAE